MSENKTLKIKKALLILAIFIPTIVAVLIYIVGTTVSNNLTKKAIMIEIITQDEIAVKINNDDIHTLINVFSDAEKSKRIPKDFTENINDLPYITVKLTSLKTEFVHKYYYNEEDKNVYTKNNSGKIYVLDNVFLERFMSTKYAISLYNHSSPPKLISSTDDIIQPKSIVWKYLDANNQYVKNNLTTAENLDNFILTTSGEFSLSFTKEPDICMITVFNGENQIFSGTLKEFTSSNIDYQNPYKYEIKAEWQLTESCKYYGEINYYFTTSISAPPIFWLEKESIESGEFVVLSGKYINNLDKIKFECTPTIDFEPRFFVDGQYVRALVPINMNLLSPTDYNITVTYSSVATSLSLKVAERADLKIRTYDTSNITVKRSKTVLDEYYNLLNTLTETTSPLKYFSGDFIEPSSLNKTEPQMTLMLGFGHTRTLENEMVSYRLDGVDYWTSESGVSVRALNTGIVSYVGYCELLGNFVVVDHGFGLKTWYTHLSTSSTKVNDSVTKTTVIGKTGKTGFTNSNGFYLITTVYNVPVSPYPLETDGVLMTNK